jgi:hypothetical protein
MTDYAWLRKKSPAHQDRINAKLVGNQNAKKHGLYSRTPPTTTCNACPNTETCPYFKPGNACVFVWDKLMKMEKRLKGGAQ